MKSQVIISNDGQELQRVDINRAAASAALADDSALSVVNRLAATSPRKRAIQTYAGEVVSVGTGGVVVNPFWAFLGPTSGPPADITNTRSAAFLGITQPLTAQSGGVGTFRIDLVYATLFVDQNKAPEARYLKDPTTGNISSTPSNVAVEIYSYVTIGVVSGTTSASPSTPSIPSDPAGGFNIPLAYVRLPNAFGALSTTTNAMIFDVANTTRGGARPAHGMSSISSFGGPTLTKSKTWIGATTTGRESVFFGIDSSILGIVNNLVVYDTIDWRKRILDIRVQTAATGTELPWHSAVNTALPTTAGTTTHFLANSFIVSGVNKTVYSITNGGGTFILYVDVTTGALTASITGSPDITGFFWIDVTAQIANS